MRIPRSEIYRAFPELDRFADDRCREFVAHAQANRRLSRAASLLGALLMAAALWALVGVLWIPLLSVFPGGPGPVLLIVAISTTVLSGALAGLRIRDQWLRWAVGQQIDAARCPACRYSLLGIPAADGIITCPECGDGRDVAELTMSTEQVARLAEGQTDPRDRLS